jgi:hypothetical protein
VNGWRGDEEMGRKKKPGDLAADLAGKGVELDVLAGELGAERDFLAGERAAGARDPGRRRWEETTPTARRRASTDSSGNGTSPSPGLATPRPSVGSQGGFSQNHGSSDALKGRAVHALSSHLHYTALDTYRSKG